jgi:hypothetical protein
MGYSLPDCTFICLFSAHSWLLPAVYDLLVRMIDLALQVIKPCMHVYAAGG